LYQCHLRLSAVALQAETGNLRSSSGFKKTAQFWRVLNAISALRSRNTFVRFTNTSAAQMQTPTTIKRKTFMNNPKIIFTSVLLALACFTASPYGTGKAGADAHPDTDCHPTTR